MPESVETSRASGYWVENIRRSLRDWEGQEGRIGLLVIVATALGYGVLAEDPNRTRIVALAIVAYISLLVLVISPWRMWRDSQAEIAHYEERLCPQLSFVFEPKTPPYLSNYNMPEEGRRGRKLRLYRVGIRNDSAEVIERVRVVLESASFVVDGKPIPAGPDQPALVEHALNVMGIDEKDGAVGLSPGDRPTAYVDVVQQLIPEGKEPDSWMSLCYASGHRIPMSARGQWLFDLRVEGGGAYSRARFVVEGSEQQKEINMRRK